MKNDEELYHYSDCELLQELRDRGLTLHEVLRKWQNNSAYLPIQINLSKESFSYLRYQSTRKRLTVEEYATNIIKRWCGKVEEDGEIISV